MNRDWREAIEPFNEGAAEYDEWYENNPAFAIELAALRAITGDMPRPRLEIGVGTGRFAQELQIGFGLDPAVAPLGIASRRNIMTINGQGEHLPLRTRVIGSVYLIFTLCFLPEPSPVLRECARVLRPGGRLIVGVVPALSPWGRRIAERAGRSDSWYRHARVRTIAETVRLLAAGGFAVLASRSTLFQTPDRRLDFEEPVAGSSEEAGFCVLVTCGKGDAACSHPT